MEQEIKVPLLIGRRKIFTNYTKVSKDNIVNILTEAFAKHLENKAEEDYLFNYIKGFQPILVREKKVRPEINNKVLENHALSIVNFVAGYLLERPIQFVSNDKNVNDDGMKILNGCLANIGKDSLDMKIASDMATCALAYKLTLPNPNFRKDFSNSPFNVYRIEPQSAFMVYTSDIGNEALLGCVMAIVKDEAGKEHIKIQAYSRDTFYLYDVDGKTIEETKSNPMGEIPLVEYEYCEQRLGAFEPVVPLLDAINKVESNRVDGVEQFIQALLVFKNVDIKKEDLTSLLEMGAIKIKDNGELEANVQYLTQELNQTQTQTLIDHLLNIVYKIVGMPIHRSGQGGDNGVAVLYKDGYTEVEARTQKVELSFKGSERKFLNLLLMILDIKTLGKTKLRGIDIDIKFTRRNFENIYQKAQTLDLLLKNPKIHPRLAFIYSGLSADPDSDYQVSEQYYKEQLKQQQVKVDETPRNEELNQQ